MSLGFESQQSAIDNLYENFVNCFKETNEAEKCNKTRFKRDLSVGLTQQIYMERRQRFGRFAQASESGNDFVMGAFSRMLPLTVTGL